MAVRRGQCAWVCGAVLLRLVYGAMGASISMVCYVNVSNRNKGGRELVQDRGEGSDMQ